MNIWCLNMADKNFIFSERVKFQYILDNRILLSARECALQLNKSRSTIYYELKKFSYVKENSFTSFVLGGSPYNQNCQKLKRFPFVCNGCPKIKKCHLNKRIYDAYYAQDLAHRLLVDSRKDTEAKRKTARELNRSVSPLIKDGLSIHVAKLSVNNCPYSESTIRRYIEEGLLEVKRIDLPRAVRFRVKKEYRYRTPKLDISVLNGRTYDDYVRHIRDNPNSRVIEVDSVIGKAGDKTALLTIYFKGLKFQLGFLYHRKHSTINDILIRLYELGRKYGFSLFDTILTDNGTEFKTLHELESQIHIRVFYCDPYASYQKAECEKNHGFFRRIVPKSRSLDRFTQEEINEIFSHINSYPRASIGNSSPHELFTRRYNSIILEELGIIKIPVSRIKLKIISR